MSLTNPYRIRVLHSYPLMNETNYENLTYQEACEKFKFLVACCLEFPDLNVRCVNIIKGKRKSIKIFQNHV